MAPYPGCKLEDVVRLRDSIAKHGLTLSVIERYLPHDKARAARSPYGHAIFYLSARRAPPPRPAVIPARAWLTRRQIVHGKPGKEEQLEVRPAAMGAGQAVPSRRSRVDAPWGLCVAGLRRP